ncbi:MAG: FG-GAP-like repeat-containing protein [Cyclobacteriaceae bacterium]
MTTLFIQIYQSASAKYVKFKRRLDKNIASGHFKQFTRKKQSQLLNKIERLRKRVLQLQTQLKLAGAGVALGLLLNTTPVQAQSTLGPFTRNYPDNPLPPPLPYMQRPNPTYVDLDGDGDLDLIVGKYDSIHYFKNLGTKSNPFYKEVYWGEIGYPFTNVNSTISGRDFVPALADIDGDGDFDLLVGNDDFKYPSYFGELFFFRNNGTATNPNFELDDTNNPFVDTYGVKFGTIRYAHPTFVDMDGDGDTDLYVGGYYDSSTSYLQLQYFENIGTKTSPVYERKTNSLTNSVNDINYSYTAPISFADLDKDGDPDAFIGIYDEIIYFRNDNGVFTSQNNQPNQSGPWIPNASSPGSSLGNPFDEINQNLPDHYNGALTPTFADVDNDGDLDVTVGYDLYTYYGNIYDLRVLYYYENKGQGVLELKEGLSSPLDGIDLGDDANASLVDIDNDGDLDILTSGGGSYTYFDYQCECTTTDYYTNNRLFINSGGVFSETTDPLLNPIADLPINDNAKIKLIDVDSDGDEDLVAPFFDSNVGLTGKVQYFENVDGVFLERTGPGNPFDFIESNPFDEVDLDLGDLNGDGLMDLIVGIEVSKLTAFENVGTIGNPEFSQQPTWETGFYGDIFFGANPKLLDLDNDGDLDIVTGKYTNMWYYENIGTSIDPEFIEYRDTDYTNGNAELVQAINNPLRSIDENNTLNLYPNLYDFDGDGDMDLIFGKTDGQFSYYENDNPAPDVIVKTSLNFAAASGAVVLDATLTLSDSDSDLITRAIVAITNYRPGDEVLSYSQQAGMELITGSFNTTTGVLTLTGLAPVSVYQQVLRSVTYQFIGTPPTTSGRLSSGRTKDVTLNRSLTISVLDQDLTSIVPKALAVQISFPDPNQPPVINPPTSIVGIGKTVDLDFSSLISDPNNNLDAASFKVIQDPVSGATYTITGLVIKLDYSGKIFAGQDQLTVEICDLDGACTSSIVTVTVEGDIIVYNGFSPNGDASNPYFQIGNITLIEPQNKVTIFNRWGDRVFEVDNYDNNTKRFEGKNNNGNDLPSGVYFYRIEFSSGREELTGYLTLKK